MAAAKESFILNLLIKNLFNGRPINETIKARMRYIITVSILYKNQTKNKTASNEKTAFTIPLAIILESLSLSIGDNLFTNLMIF